MEGVKLGIAIVIFLGDSWELGGMPTWRREQQTMGGPRRLALRDDFPRPHQIRFGSRLTCLLGLAA
jgi:hypothetical protein